MPAMPSTRISVLIADPEPAIQHALAACLGQRYHILTAGSLAEAYAILDRAHPHAVVLELNQPDGDGIQLIERLRADSANRDTIVLCVTNRKGTRDKVRGFQVGADDYLIKPVVYDAFPVRLALLERLRQLTS